MMPPKMRLWILFVAAVTLAACVSLPPPPSEAPAAPSAAQLASRGDHAQAALAYEGEAVHDVAARAQLLLSAAREWLAAQRPADARRVLRTIVEPLAPAQHYQRELLDAQVSYQLHQAQLAWRQISALPAAVGAAAALDYYSLKMRIAFAAARPVDGIRAEIASEQYAGGDAQRVQRRRALLDELLQARARGVDLTTRPGTDMLIRGWLELGATAAPSRSLSLNSATLAARWRARYPNHPGQTILDQAFPAPLAVSAPGAHVALLLPLSGPYGADGVTVRDGFLSALYELPAAARPQVHLYDTAAMPATQALAQARSNGSTFIVGPLVPDAVASVAAQGPGNVPMLALNFLPDGQSAPAGMFQDALSPEQEAQLAAQRILADGHHRGIMLVPRNDWGTRVANAFSRALTLGGGTLIAAPTYDPQQQDYGDELRAVLGIDQSQERNQRLERALGTKFNFEPRHRGDIEFVFIVTSSALNARLIMPQLGYAYASDIPKYSIAEAYEPDTRDSNSDIAGLMYADMPWMISAQTGLAELRDSMSQSWGNRVAWRGRYFAFGYDACQLMLAMSTPYGTPSAVQIDGLTGQLHFDADRRIQRELIWVRVDRNGNPRPLPPSSGAVGPATTGAAGPPAAPSAPLAP
ncbi:MAG TPA: penicillin-binding protein activator [Steroidobacteraceae bacterium]|nr:penicillin-binding protein activator [Steroidobacteraceae bacterium]